VAEVLWYLIVSGGERREIEQAAEGLTEAGFQVALLEGVVLGPGGVGSGSERAQRVSATGRALAVGAAQSPSSAQVTAGPVRIDGPGRRVYVGEQLVSLTSSEFNLIEYLVRHRDQVISKPELLIHLRGTDQYNPNVVEAIVCTLRGKLGPPAVGLVETVRGVGYIVRSDTEQH